MTVLALIAQPEHESQIQQIASTFGVNWPHLTAQIVSFAIVCALLYWLAYEPVLRMLDARREQIAQGLANTAKINAALADIEAQRQRVLAEARTQSAQIVEDARQAARRLSEHEARRAEADAAETLRKAGEAATLERARLLAAARQEVGRLVVQTAGAVVGRVLTPEDQRRLNEETSRRLAAS
jgi:F-type H+-transporting ATPase subunit b